MQQTTVRASVLQGLAAAIADLGGDPKRVMGRLGPAQETLPLTEFMALLNEAAAETAAPHFGLHFAARYSRKDLGLIAYLFTYNARLSDSMQDFRQFFGTLQTNSHYAAEVRGDWAVVEYQAPGGDVQFRAQDAEFSLMLHIRCLQFSLGDRWHPAEVAFQHPALGDAAVYTRILGCPVRFDAPMNQIRFAKSLLYTANPKADDNMVRLIRRALIEENAAAERMGDPLRTTRRAIADHLRLQETVNLTGIAAECGLRPAQLSRVLARRGLRFRDLVNAQRLALAKELLAQTDLPISTISERLGYAETSAFSRMFSRGTGQSARAFRAAALGSDDLDHILVDGQHIAAPRDVLDQQL